MASGVDGRPFDMINSAERHFPAECQLNDASEVGRERGNAGQTRHANSCFEDGKPVEGVCWGHSDDGRWPGGLGTASTVLRAASKERKCQRLSHPEHISGNVDERSDT